MQNRGTIGVCSGNRYELSVRVIETHEIAIVWEFDVTPPGMFLNMHSDYALTVARVLIKPFQKGIAHLIPRVRSSPAFVLP